MKKVLLCAAIAVLTMTTSFAQASFGAKAGVNFANITGDDLDGTEGKIGFHIGAVAEISFSEKFSFQPELLFSTQGLKAEEGDGKLKLNYINLPLMGKYYVMDGLSLELGPQVGFLLSAKSDDGNDDVDVKDSLKSIDFGLNIGVGYKMESGLNFGVRYNLGLSDINDVDGYDGENKNGVIQVSVGYFFN